MFKDNKTATVSRSRQVAASKALELAHDRASEFVSDSHRYRDYKDLYEGLEAKYGEGDAVSPQEIGAAVKAAESMYIQSKHTHGDALLLQREEKAAIFYALWEEIERKNSERTAKINQAKESGSLTEFRTGYRYAGAANHADAWVIMPDGTDLLPTKQYQRQHKGVHAKAWDIVPPEALVIQLDGSRSGGHTISVIQAPPDRITEAQAKRFIEIEAELTQQFGHMERSAPDNSQWVFTSHPHLKRDSSTTISSGEKPTTQIAEGPAKAIVKEETVIASTPEAEAQAVQDGMASLLSKFGDRNAGKRKR